MLITIYVGITFLAIFIVTVGLIITVRQTNQNTTYLAEIVERATRSTERVAEIAERIDARLRRQFTDIGGDLGD